MLQPLNIGVFSPPKQKYRQNLGRVAISTDYTPIGKRGFVECYIAASKAAITQKNILSSWCGSGLWDSSLNKPNIKKPLSNPLVFQLQGVDIETPIEVIESPSAITIPRKGSDIPNYTRRALEYTPLSELPTSQLLFRKIAKEIDSKNSEIASLQEEIVALKAQVAVFKPLKRKRVYKDPNKHFVNIQEIMETRAGMAAPN